MARINMTITLDPQVKELLKYRAESLHMAQSAYLEKAILSDSCYEEISKEASIATAALQDIAAKLPTTSAFDNALREAVDASAPPVAEVAESPKESPAPKAKPRSKSTKPMNLV